jgi:2'-5' RNA ligase
VRLFVAINPPASEKSRLHAELQRAAADLPVRWLDADSLHITLKFLGQVADTAVAPIGAALAEAVRNISPFDVVLGSFGAFPTISRPSIFWVGANSADLIKLQTQVDAAYERIGFAKEARAYRPHITVARLQKNVPLKDRALMDRIVGDFEYKTIFRVESADLMRSQVGSRGARYDVMESMVLH